RLEYLRALVHDRVQKAAGRWEENPASGSWAVFDRAARTCLPEEMRRRTLVVVPWESPYFRRQLTPDEQAAYPAVSRLTVRHLQALGFAAVEVGRGLTADGYLDHCHLVRVGGTKMAAAVAPAVERLTRRLGHGKRRRRAAPGCTASRGRHRAAGEQGHHLPVEGGDVVGLATGHQVAVHHHFFVH